MPLKKCSSGGNSGWKWGDSGHCYTGPDGKKKAIKQGYAENPQHFRDVMKSEGIAAHEIELMIAEALCYDEDDMYLSLAYISQDERNKIAEEDFGWPDERKYPIRNQSDLDAAVRLIGRAPKEERAMITRNIKRIARRKNLTLPDSWVNE